MKKIYEDVLDQDSLQSVGEKRFGLKPTTVKEFFQYSEQLAIPDYQRPYAWGIENIDDLLKDIEKIAGSDKGWFLGMIFTVRERNEIGEWVKYLLDGQQRITTLQLIINELSLFRFHFEEFNWPENKMLEEKVDRLVTASRECLFDLSGKTDKIRFVTEPVSRSLVEKFLMACGRVESTRKLAVVYESLYSDADVLRRQGSKTAGRVRIAVEHIRRRIKDIVGGGHKEQVLKLLNFGEAVLYDLWVIQVPLLDISRTTEIFEGLNNRGRALSLVSKLRFKSLLYAGDLASEIRQQWKVIYAGLEFLEDTHYIKSEDDFFKVYINSIAGDSITVERDLVNAFTMRCVFGLDDVNEDISAKSVYPEILAESLGHVARIHDFFRILEQSVDINSAYFKAFGKREGDVVRALFEVVKRCLVFSSNSRFLLFHAIQKHDWQGADKRVFIDVIWKIIRCVVVVELIDELKSNDTRTKYLGMLKDWDNQLLILSSMASNINRRSLVGLLRSTDNSRAKFILSLYAFFKDTRTLTSYAPTQMRHVHLDHFWPRAYKSEWGVQANYTHQDIIDYLESLDFAQFTSVDKKSLISAVMALEETELKVYTTTPYKQPNSIVEWIGNKWILHAGTNISCSNESFEVKKGLYLQEAYVKIPRNDLPNTGINAFNEFTYKSVILRSLHIVNTLADELSKKVEAPLKS